MKEFDHEELKSLEYELPDEILKYKMCGDFAGARQSIERWMQYPVTEGMKTRLGLTLVFPEPINPIITIWFMNSFPPYGKSIIRFSPDNVSERSEFLPSDQLVLPEYSGCPLFLLHKYL